MRLAVGLTFLAASAGSAAAQNPCAKTLGGAPRFRPQMEALGERINPVLYAPSALDASLVSATSAVISWQDNSYDDNLGSRNEDSFVVERWDTANGWSIVAVTGPDAHSIVDRTLHYDTTYYYRVSAFESFEGYSSYSNEDSITTPEQPPRAPAFLRALSVTSSAVTIGWNDRSSNEDGFEIYRALPNGTYEYYDFVFSNTTLYTDTFVTPGETYFYYVAAYNGGGFSDGSNEIQVDVPETIPKGASALSVRAPGARQVVLDWTDNSRAEQGFRIERSVNGSGFVPYVTVGANVQSFADSNVLPDTRYAYRVVAFNSFGNAADVAQGSVRTPIEIFTNLGRAKDIYAVSVPSAQGGILRVYDRLDGHLVFSNYAFPGFLGEVRIATGDVTGDGVADVVAAAGPGGGSHVKVFDGTNGQLAYSFFAYDGWFGGVWVGVGDVDHDGKADIVTGVDAGGGPHVKAFSGANGTEIRSFFAYDGQFGGGVRVAVGDTDGDGYADIVTAAGASGGPHVKVFSGKTGEELQSFLAYDPSITTGVYVAAGDLDGDGKAEIVTGVGGIAPHVKVIDGRTGREIFGFYAYDVRFGGGVRVAVSAGADGRTPLIITGPGKGGGPHIRGFNGRTGELDPSVNFFADDALFIGGVYVGGVP